ncbi:DUF305 domain-containing protein [Nocardia cyriacigeorgica]|uniref:DUF305 domain-containing protein n=1 Tax=Nocardia cyriacigeorgica TaxID=135487 RepID=A0ABX0CLL6_9NOCA|nr:DUF305 domain-containing protein [Nocardia cyriacigeorgica]NEW52553.1 DUF305 domain-containing protein [Nocardia cyriacigeorgica]NEW56802.1 DUF305 domain-containing protein [Nocardia cyriacigeorgica]
MGSVDRPKDSEETGPDATSGAPEAGPAESDTTGEPGAAPIDAAADSADDDTEPADDDDAGFSGQVRRQRTALLVLGVIGAIVLGFAIGVLARLPLDGDSEPSPNSVDVGFSQDMSAHHAQAVEMAGVALIRSTDQDVRRLAYDILTTQQNQVGRMQGWLQLWGEPARGVDGYMGWMTDHGGGHDHTAAASGHAMGGPVREMPGMASSEDLAALRRAEGAELDVLFLQLMLRHHQGGLPMIQYAATYAETTAVRSLASNMDQTQQGESHLMTGMLAARGATPLPLN